MKKETGKREMKRGKRRRKGAQRTQGRKSKAQETANQEAEKMNKKVRQQQATSGGREEAGRNETQNEAKKEGVANKMIYTSITGSGADGNGNPNENDNRTADVGSETPSAVTDFFRGQGPGNQVFVYGSGDW